MRAQRKRTRFGLVTPMAVATLPKVTKPATDGEATSTRTHRAARGDWGGRASTESVWVLGDPAWRAGRRNGRSESLTTWRPRPGVGPAHRSGEAGSRPWSEGAGLPACFEQRGESRVSDRCSITDWKAEGCAGGRPASTRLPAALETGSQGEARPAVPVVHPEGPHLPSRRPRRRGRGCGPIGGRRVSMA